jgi:hypothetical protein
MPVAVRRSSRDAGPARFEEPERAVMGPASDGAFVDARVAPIDTMAHRAHG